MIGPFELIAAFLLDLAIGDPRWLPHPVRLIGRGIAFLENLSGPAFRRTTRRSLAFSWSF